MTRKTVIIAAIGRYVGIASKIALALEKHHKPITVSVKQEPKEEVFKYENTRIMENTHILPDEYKSGRELRRERRKNNRKN